MTGLLPSRTVAIAFFSDDLRSEVFFDELAALWFGSA
jgi:hypothetical protein